MDWGSLPKGTIIAGLLGFSIWVGAIIVSGAGWNLFGVNWDFTNSGGFGDSFGPISALMATVAAIGAILAYSSQHNELARLRAREEVEDERRKVEQKASSDREAARDAKSRDAAFEGTFFKLLETFANITSHVDIKTGAGDNKTAQDAFQSILYFASRYRGGASNNLNKVWDQTITKYRNDLNHYFRFMYHLILFVHTSDVGQKYFYIRLIRSMLSESEIILLGLNCEFGEGRDKFRPLLEEYALLHNMSPDGRLRWFKETTLNVSAFDPS